MTNFLSRHSGWLWFAAFICALFPINEFQLEFFAAAVLLLFAWAYASLSQTLDRGWNLPRTATLVFAGLFWLLVTASVFWSEVKSISLIGLCFFSVMPISFFIGLMAKDLSFFRRTGYALAIVFAVMSVWAVIQFFFLNTYFGGQARHPLNDPSSLGALFSLALFCTLGWILSARTKRENAFAVILGVLLVCGIFSTVARGPVFAFLPGIVLFCILLWPQVKAQRKSLLIVLLGGLACYGVMQTGIHKKFDIGERVFGTITLAGDITNNRIEVWAATAEMIKDRPWLGTGIGTYFLYFQEYRRPTDRDGATLAHNDPMQFWAELGILGPLLFYAFAGAAIFRTAAALKKLGPEKHNERIAIVSVFAGLGAMLVQSHVSFNHYNISILMLSGFLLAAWFHMTGKAIEGAPRPLEMPSNLPAGMNRALLAMPFVMLGWLLLSILAGDYYVNKARDDLFKERMFDFADNINNANRVSQGLNFRTYLFAVNVPMSILEHNATMIDEAEKKKLYEQVVGYMNNAIALNPRLGSPYYYLGRVQGLVPADVIPEGTKSPEDFYKMALRYEPLHLGARMELLKAAKEKGASLEQQIAILEPGLGFTYNVPAVEAYYGEAARLYLEAGNYVKAKQVMSQIYNFKQRSNYSLIRQNTSIPQAIMGGDEIFEGGH